MSQPLQIADYSDVPQTTTHRKAEQIIIEIACNGDINNQNLRELLTIERLQELENSSQESIIL